MVRAAAASTQIEDSFEAGRALGADIGRQLDGSTPDAVLLFASPVFDAEMLLQGLHSAIEPEAVIGCSSAGEFTFKGTSASSAVALALMASDISFRAHLVRDINDDVTGAAESLARGFDPNVEPERPHRAALLLMDTLAGYGEEFLDAFTAATEGEYQVFGGGAADDAAFTRTLVYCGREAVAGAAAVLEIRSTRKIGIGVSHGWTPASPPMTATASSGLRLVELDGRAAADEIERFAREHGLPFDRAEPLPFFLHHVLGITSDGGYKLRVPLAIDEAGAVLCAAEIPEQATVRIMQTRSRSAAEAAQAAARRAWLGLEGSEPGVAIFFDCAATRLRLGAEFGESVREIENVVGRSPLVGCNTYGQFARLPGQFSGFHNCTAVVCVLPQ
jgi:hypothetical protein